MRAGRVPAGLAVNVLQFLRVPRTAIRFDADKSAMRLDVRIGSILQPAQWVRTAREISECGFDLRAFSESFVESFAESAERQRIAEDQDADAVGLMRDGLRFHGGRVCDRQERTHRRRDYLLRAM